MDSHEILALLQPYAGGESLPRTDWNAVAVRLDAYLDLILHWNARTNLTAIRKPEEIVRRHFGESLFAGLHLGACATLLDFGSGAGFPGIPIQILRPDLRVTLGESQHKKASFLREALRTLELKSEVWASRIEEMPPARRFEAVILRAVDQMDVALRAAAPRAMDRLIVLGTKATAFPAEVLTSFSIAERLSIPESETGQIITLSRTEL